MRWLAILPYTINSIRRIGRLDVEAEEDIGHDRAKARPPARKVRPLIRALPRGYKECVSSRLAQKTDCPRGCRPRSRCSTACPAWPRHMGALSGSVPFVLSFPAPVEARRRYSVNSVIVFHLTTGHQNSAYGVSHLCVKQVLPSTSRISGDMQQDQLQSATSRGFQTSLSGGRFLKARAASSSIISYSKSLRIS